MDAAAMAIAVGGGSSGPGSSSSSSASSGYGSATTTPTTPLGAHYETSATIATVAPFYSEALTSLDAQQRQQQQQQQQHAHQQHAQQQHAQHQQQQQQQSHFYHQNYSYAGAGGGGMGVAGGGAMSLDAYNYSGYNYNATRYEKLPSVKYNSSSNNTSYGSNINNSSSNSNTGSNSASNSSNIYSSSSNGNSSKPQAAATPFYAQPQSVSMSPMPMYMGNSNPYEAYKAYKPPAATAAAAAAAQQQYHNLGVGVGMGVPMGMNMNMQKPLQQQQQQQLHPPQQQQQLHHPQQQQQQAQSMQQLQAAHQQHLPQQQQLPPLEPSYAAIKPSSRYPNMAPSVYGGGVGGAGGVAGLGGGAAVGGVAGTGGGTAAGYYDKYAMSLYPPNGGLSFGAPAPLYSPPELADSGYRKSGNAANCHWTTPNPSATGPSYHQASAGPAAGEMYYKYAGNPYQASMTQQAYGARGMWTAAPPNPVENSRQSCCSQPYPPQQSCYYPQRTVAPPPPPQNVAQAPPPPQYPGNPGKLKHPTDLYAASYEAACANNSSQRSYMPQLGMAGGGGGGYGAMEANVSTAYYNDLGSLDAYGHPAPPAAVVPPQQLQRAPAYQVGVGVGVGAASSSLDYSAYRKRPLPATVAPQAPLPSNNCYLAQSGTPMGHLSGLEANVDNYVGYDLHATSMPPHYAKPAPAAASAHSSNIRDFLSSWNDDEEEQPLAVVAPTQVQPPPASSSFMYETLPPAGPVATAVLDAQVGDLNLPDIIIDHHEKVVEDSFGSFDVEKELDELRLKTQPAETEVLAEMLREPPKVQEVLPLQEAAPPATLPVLPVLSQSLPALLVEPAVEPKQEQAQLESDQSADNSNESTFEKEYETFIHKIGSSEEDEEGAGELREHPKRFKFYKRKRRNTENAPEQQQQSKRISPAPIPQAETASSPAPPPRAPAPTTDDTLPTPALSPKPSTRASRLRNRIRMLKVLGYESPQSKHRFYFRALKLLRRRFAQSQLRQQRLQRLRRQLALRKERRLPLIKRQSAKQYAQKGEEQAVQEQEQGEQKKELERKQKQEQLQPIPCSSNRETVIKSVSALREEQQERSEPVLELQSGDSNHTLQSVELLGSFKGFDDVENTNLSPKAKLREEAKPVAAAATPAISGEDQAQAMNAKQLEIQRWLHNNLEESHMNLTSEPTNAIICLSSSSASSSSSGSSSSSSSSSSSDDDSSDSSDESSHHEEQPQQQQQEQLKPSMSSSSSEQSESDSNELAALQKELSQQPETALPAEITANHVESLDCDIAKLKQILESDGDGDEQEQEQEQKTKQEEQPIPKLSDLSKNALNSSLKSSLRPQEAPTVAAPPRELSVEEALAEMYQQIGEDCEDRKEDLENASAVAGQDVLLINLAEIFDNNSSDLYVVQCDMNENILGVVAEQDREPSHEAQSELQLIELLADPIDQALSLEPEHEPDETAYIHHEEVVAIPESSKEQQPDRARRQLLKYLHAKYVQCNISRFYHAQRVLKKYKRRRPNPRSNPIPPRVQSSVAHPSLPSTLC